MTKVIAATVEIKSQAGRPTPTIHVKLQGPYTAHHSCVFKSKAFEDDILWLGYQPDGDLGWFCCEVPRNKTGFGGHLYELPLPDGTKAQVKGPWSSRPSCVQQHFPDDEPLIQCTCEYQQVFVRKSVIESFGIRLECLPLYPTDTEPSWTVRTWQKD